MDGRCIMKLKKFRKIMLIIGLCIFVFAGVGLLVMYNIGDRILNEAIDAQLADIDSLLDDAAMPGHRGAAEENTGDKAVDNTGSTPTDNSGNGTGTGNPPQSNGSGVSEGQKSGGGDNDAPDTGKGTDSTADSASVSGSATASNANDAPDQNEQPGTSAPDTGNSDTGSGDGKLTIDEINEIKDSVTAVDKIETAALMLKRLSSSDIDVLKKMLAGGVSGEEKNEAKKLVYQKFTEEEVEAIKEIYKKYMNDK